jgi:hypothetical protein
MTHLHERRKESEVGSKTINERSSSMLDGSRREYSARTMIRRIEVFDQSWKEAIGSSLPSCRSRNRLLLSLFHAYSIAHFFFISLHMSSLHSYFVGVTCLLLLAHSVVTAEPNPLLHACNELYTMTTNMTLPLLPPMYNENRSVYCLFYAHSRPDKVAMGDGVVRRTRLIIGPLVVHACTW